MEDLWAIIYLIVDLLKFIVSIIFGWVKVLIYCIKSLINAITTENNEEDIKVKNIFVGVMSIITIIFLLWVFDYVFISQRCHV